jgi:hypothetical protein
MNKVLISFLVLLISFNSFAEKGEYFFNFNSKNHWIDQHDILPLRQAIKFYKKNNVAIQAVCSTKDKFCAQRVEILQQIFKREKTKQNIVSIVKAANLTQNQLAITTLQNIDKSSLILNYKEDNLTKKSSNDLKKLLQKADLKYLSKFTLYCKSLNKTCNKRFNKLNSEISKLTFKYNFAKIIDAQLTQEQVKLSANRHDFNFNTMLKYSLKNKKSQPQQKKFSFVGSKKPNIISFKNNSAIIEDSQQEKLNRLIKKNYLKRFNFVCSDKNKVLCQQRIHSIKNYALRNNDIVEMYQIKGKIKANDIIITDK